MEKFYLDKIIAKEKSDFLNHYRDSYITAPLNCQTKLLSPMSDLTILKG
jgi:hypothetical protein